MPRLLLGHILYAHLLANVCSDALADPSHCRTAPETAVGPLLGGGKPSHSAADPPRVTTTCGFRDSMIHWTRCMA